uniref:2'-5' RNA ligase family protein n=1 Tax=Plectus sambesii TaxID=2011161 RepID=A0A914V1J1_9BILA
MSSNDSPKSALCLILPSEVATEIQAIRALHDKQFFRWPPHINLIHPFYLDTDKVFDECAEKIAQLFTTKRFQPFTIHLDYSCFDIFEHIRCCTLLLKPRQDAENQLIELQKELQNLFPDLLNKRFPVYQPHLSLGQFDSTRVKEFAQQFATEWESKAITVDWTIDRVSLFPAPISTSILFSGSQ